MEKAENQSDLLGEDILSFSDSSGDEETPLTKTHFHQPALESNLEVTSNGNDSGSGKCLILQLQKSLPLHQYQRMVIHMQLQ